MTVFSGSNDESAYIAAGSAPTPISSEVDIPPGEAMGRHRRGRWAFPGRRGLVQEVVPP
jgi:hypothetical protein